MSTFFTSGTFSFQGKLRSKLSPALSDSIDEQKEALVDDIPGFDIPDRDYPSYQYDENDYDRRDELYEEYMEIERQVERDWYDYYEGGFHDFNYGP